MPNQDDREFAEIDVRPYFAFVRRNGGLMLTVVGVFIAGATLLSLLSPRSWTATSAVAVPQPTTPQAQVIGGIQATAPTVVYSQATYARLLTSRTVLQAVIKKLHLQVDPQTLAGQIKATPIRETLLIEIRVTGPERKQTEDISNTLAESLVEYDRQGVNSELSQNRRFVETRLAGARTELQRREDALNRFNQREDLAALQAELNRQVSGLGSLRQAHEQNAIDLQVARDKLAQVVRELASTSPLRVSATSMQTNSVATSSAAQLRVKLADLNAQRAKLLEEYVPNSPVIADIDAQIAQTRKDIADAERREPHSTAQETNAVRVQLESQRSALGVDVAGLVGRERSLSLAIPRLEQQVEALNARLIEKTAEANQLSRALNSAQSIFATLSSQETDAALAESMKRGFVRVADRAVAQPTPRGTARKASLAAVLGLLLGALGAFAIERWRLAMPISTSAQAVPDEQPEFDRPTVLRT